jgi:hypothetical protein
MAYGRSSGKLTVDPFRGHPIIASEAFVTIAPVSSNSFFNTLTTKVTKVTKEQALNVFWSIFVDPDIAFLGVQRGSAGSFTFNFFVTFVVSYGR